MSQEAVHLWVPWWRAQLWRPWKVTGVLWVEEGFRELGSGSSGEEEGLP